MALKAWPQPPEVTYQPKTIVNPAVQITRNIFNVDIFRADFLLKGLLKG